MKAKWIFSTDWLVPRYKEVRPGYPLNAWRNIPSNGSFLPRSEIPDDVIAAYRSADYRIGTGTHAFTFHINQCSEPLARLLAASGERHGAWITACNPLGKLQGLEANLTACAHLHERLRQLVNREDRIIEGAGCDPSGVWPPEKGFLALGLNLEAARNLGTRFGQNAIVWIEKNAVPELILLR